MLEEEVWDRPEVIYQYAGWTALKEIRRQLAIALDVLPRDVPDIGLGGPLLASVQLRISVRQAASYFETVVGGRVCEDFGDQDGKHGGCEST